MGFKFKYAYSVQDDMAVIKIEFVNPSSNFCYRCNFFVLCTPKANVCDIVSMRQFILVLLDVSAVRLRFSQETPKS